MKIYIEDDEFVAVFGYGCVNTAKKIYKNKKVVDYKWIGEMTLGEEFNYDDEKSLIDSAEMCILMGSDFKTKHKFINPKIIKEIPKKEWESVLEHKNAELSHEEKRLLVMLSQTEMDLDQITMTMTMVMEKEKGIDLLTDYLNKTNEHDPQKILDKALEINKENKKD